MQRIASSQNNFQIDSITKKSSHRTRHSSGSAPTSMGDELMAMARQQMDEAHRVSPTAEMFTSDHTVKVSLPASFDPTAEGFKPFPFFYYRDYSCVEDPDPCQHLTPPGRVPNFVAKMHAILSRSDLSEIIGWLPHGRSWMILNPKKFEKEVLPVYFEHAKLSSFIRQANGWGFRRVISGRDRNSYYHPKFLRALPHLCKDMKRPGVSEKQPLDPDHEPDFALISQMFPVPEKPRNKSIFLQFILDHGPNARMPIVSEEEPSVPFLTKKRSQSYPPAEPLTGLSITQESLEHAEPKRVSLQRQPGASTDTTKDQDISATISQALAGLPDIPPFIPSANGGGGGAGFELSAFLNNEHGGNLQTGSAAFQAGFLAAQGMFAASHGDQAAQGMFASQGDQFEQQLLNDPTIFSSFQASDHTTDE